MVSADGRECCCFVLVGARIILGSLSLTRTHQQNSTGYSEWLNGMAHGKGVETFPDGSVRHDGLWVEDEPVLN